MKKLFVFSLTILFLSSATVYSKQEKPMLIAVASQVDTKNTAVQLKAARCTFYLIFDASGKLTDAIKNPYKDAKRSAGRKVAVFLAKRGVSILIAGEFGKRMINSLKDKGIKYIKKTGRVQEAVKQTLNNNLSESTLH